MGSNPSRSGTFFTQKSLQVFDLEGFISLFESGGIRTLQRRRDYSSPPSCAPALVTAAAPYNPQFEPASPSFESPAHSNRKSLLISRLLFTQRRRDYSSPPSCAHALVTSGTHFNPQFEPATLGSNPRCIQTKKACCLAGFSFRRGGGSLYLQPRRWISIFCNR